MKITKKYITEDLGCEKEIDASGNPFYSFGEGFFVKAQFHPEYWHFIIPELEEFSEGYWAMGQITEVELFERLFL